MADIFCTPLKILNIIILNLIAIMILVIGIKFYYSIIIMSAGASIFTIINIYWIILFIIDYRRYKNEIRPVHNIQII